MKKVFIIHTSMALYDRINTMFQELIPDANVVNLIEDTMLKDVMTNGGLTPEITRRICSYVLQAQTTGADVVLNACSSVAEAIDVARSLTSIPCLKIDEPMAEEAVMLGKSIAVFGTVGTTLAPSSRLIESTAKKLGRDVTVHQYLVDGAFQVLTEEKNPEKHNQMVLDLIRKVEKDHDVIVLAQGSMTILIPYIQNLGKPVLYSLKSGILKVKEVLEQCK